MLPPPGVHGPIGAPSAILTYSSGADGPNGGLDAPRALPKHVQSLIATIPVQNTVSLDIPFDGSWIVGIGSLTQVAAPTGARPLKVQLRKGDTDDPFAISVLGPVKDGEV